VGIWRRTDKRPEAPSLAWAGNRLAALLKCPDMLARVFRDVSHCVLFVNPMCRETSQSRECLRR
jgi:hypothetical protein